jgi:uncharacterized secreted protein with C-terminal beta-propeller domain
VSDFDSRARKAADAVRQQITENASDSERGIRRAQRSPARVAIPSAVAAAVALIVGVVVVLPHGGDDGTSSAGPGVAYAVPGALQPFDTCDTVLQYFKDQAPEYLIQRAGGGDRVATDTGTGAAEQRTAKDSSNTTPESASTPQDYSTTNVQEAGIDEPDIVKTDGKRIVAVAQARVHLVGLDGGKMRLRKTLPDTMVRNVFLSGDRVLVFSGQTAQSAEPGLRWAGQQAILTMYDISDLSDPRLIAKLTVDGNVLDARLVGTQVRVVTISSPDVNAPAPVYAPDGGITEKSKEELRAAVASTRVDDWIPTYALQDGAGGEVSKGRLVECAHLAHPETFSGLDTVAVSAFDMGSALQSRQTVGVIAGGQQIYATDTSTYVSTTDWTRDGSAAKTSLHKFVTASSGASTYQGSGEVPGTLLNQYAMSEYDGVLRVASTVSERRGWTNPRQLTHGVVTTLQEQDGALRQLGQVGGLGQQDNESIKAVRFIEDRGYVVTFRSTDPLYVLDLHNAASPKVVGELKIPGYSGYLHPIGENLLLGVGQSGLDSGIAPSPTTRRSQVGVQFSLFDISDPAAPRRIDTQTYGGGAAAAEFDPKAFLYWEPRNLIIAPTNLHGDYRGKGAFSGLVLLRADAGGLKELGRLATSKAYGTVNRSLVVGDTVYMLTDHALQANSLDTHREIDQLTL